MKKGFTLIELLAVIVILAVIALIATPIIMNAINSAKKGAAKDSGYGYISAVEYYIAQSYNDDDANNDVAVNGNFDYDNLKLHVNAKGSLPTDVDVELVNGKVDNGTMVVGGYTLTIVDGIITDVAEASASVAHTITVTGTISCAVVSKTEATVGEEIVVGTLVGYSINTPYAYTDSEEEITVNYVNGTGFVFTMPDTNVTVNVFCSNPHK